MIHDNPFLITGNLATDDRGILRFVNEFNFENVKRFYMVENHVVGFIRAWHAHRHEAKYVFVVEGAALVAAVRVPVDELVPSIEVADLTRYVLSAAKPSVLYIPPGFANGFKTLTADTKVMFFSTATIAESLNDDIRWPASYLRGVWDVEER